MSKRFFVLGEGIPYSRDMGKTEPSTLKLNRTRRMDGALSQRNGVGCLIMCFGGYVILHHELGYKGL